ncbi:hypothetical protein [Aromatoleum anaerobium]|uniref:Uncharacterized protein n=1 Tax=Aromatoleum anaerobium TaxID=182180 RepID=A0ABX1PRM3_9RHOO|nr:hypothetical protein [Aromatoleum anaerobium]MCK0508573.1 hypothetical protein [Aromatoleum anaerobium]
MIIRQMEFDREAQFAPAVTRPAPATLALSHFVDGFGDSLLEAVRRQNPPVYDGKPDPHRHARMDRLARQPFPAQREAVGASIGRMRIERLNDAVWREQGSLAQLCLDLRFRHRSGP